MSTEPETEKIREKVEAGLSREQAIEVLAHQMKLELTTLPAGQYRPGAATKPRKSATTTKKEKTQI